MTNTNQTKGTMFQMTTEEGLKWEAPCVDISNFENHLEEFAQLIQVNNAPLLIGITEEKPLIAAIPLAQTTYFLTGKTEDHRLKLPTNKRQPEWLLDDFGNKIPIAKLSATTTKKYLRTILQEIVEQNKPLVVTKHQNDITTLVPLAICYRQFQPRKSIEVNSKDHLDYLLKDLFITN